MPVLRFAAAELRSAQSEQLATLPGRGLVGARGRARQAGLIVMGGNGNSGSFHNFVVYHQAVKWEELPPTE